MHNPALVYFSEPNSPQFTAKPNLRSFSAAARFAADRLNPASGIHLKLLNISHLQKYVIQKQVQIHMQMNKTKLYLKSYTLIIHQMLNYYKSDNTHNCIEI